MAKKKKAKRATKKSSRRTTNTRAKKVAAKSAPKSPSRKKSPTSTSVDGILKRFKQERAVQESQLVAVRKKIADLEAKSRAFQEQIAKLNDQESETLQQVDELDAKRDQEISELLSRLGVRVGQMDSSSGSGQTPFGGHASGGSDED